MVRQCWYTLFMPVCYQISYHLRAGAWAIYGRSPTVIEGGYFVIALVLCARECRQFFGTQLIKPDGAHCTHLDIILSCHKIARQEASAALEGHVRISPPNNFSRFFASIFIRRYIECSAFIPNNFAASVAIFFGVSESVEKSLFPSFPHSVRSWCPQVAQPATFVLQLVPPITGKLLQCVMSATFFLITVIAPCLPIHSPLLPPKYSVWRMY